MRKLNCVLILFVIFIQVSCISRVDKLMKIKNYFKENEEAFNLEVKRLGNIVNTANFLDNANIEFSCKISAKSSSKRLRVFDSDFLYNSPIQNVHIYNNNICELELQNSFHTYAFKMQNGVILQYNDCFRFKPRGNENGNVFENSRIVQININSQWIAYIEK